MVSVERLKPLHDKARELLAPLRTAELRLVFGDGMLGHAPGAPYDSIIAAAGGATIPQAWLDQLAVGGGSSRRCAQARRGPGARGRRPARESGYARSVHEAVQFVPLKSGLRR